MTTKEYFIENCFYKNSGYRLLIKYKIGYSWFIGSASINRLRYDKDDSIIYYIHIGHPMNMKTKYIYCGRKSTPLDSFLCEVDEIKSPREDEFEVWKKYYLLFHECVVRDKGYDSSEENLNLIKLWQEEKEK